MLERENLEEFEKTFDGEHYYVCAEVNKVMDAMEARIIELQKLNSELFDREIVQKSLLDRINNLESILDADPRTSVSLIDENKTLRERIKELEDKLQMEHRVGEDWCAKYWELRASHPK